MTRVMSASVTTRPERAERLSAAFRAGPSPAAPTAASDRLLSYGTRLLVLAVIAQSLGHLVNFAFFDLRIDALNVDQEYATTAWAGTALTAVAAFLIAELAIVSGRRAVPLAVLAGAVAFLSLDDMISLHERIEHFDPEGNSLRYLNRVVWPAVYAPLLLFAFGGLWLLAAGFEPAARRRLRGGLGLLGLALCLEVVGAGILLLGSTRSEAPYNLEVIVEEAAELAAWGLIALAIASSRYSRGG